MKKLSLLLSMAATPLAAHPHIFVDTALAMDVDATGALTGITVSWTYDELYSLLILEDMGLDSDYDGVLNEVELAKLSGFDLNWIEGFAGDLYLTQGAMSVDMEPPQNRGISFKDGKITSVHFRPIAGVRADGLVAKAFDPTYYTAYELTGGVEIAGPCRAEVHAPDLDAAALELQKVLAEVPPDATDYPEMGETFAEEVRISCGG